MIRLVVALVAAMWLALATVTNIAIWRGRDERAGMVATAVVAGLVGAMMLSVALGGSLL